MQDKGLGNKNQLDQSVLSLGEKISAAKRPLDDLLKKTLKKVNALEVRTGQKKTDFDKEVKNGVMKLITGVNKQLAKNNI